MKITQTLTKMFSALAALALLLSAPKSSAALPNDKLFHLAAHIGERISPNSLRVGRGGFEVGRLNLTTYGLSYRLGQDIFVAGIGPAYGSDGFSNSEWGLFTEFGVHYLTLGWIDLRVDFTGFLVAKRNMRSEVLLGAGFHF